ncbi:MAG: putative rane protein [Gemmatimonadales bacterium]|jgi:putative membrane protein|nr:putative rane protein [Gemmatimonadales bacterium]
MTARWLAASLHLLALGIGLGAVWARGRALRSSLDAGTLRQVFFADTLWGLAAVLWISTGLWRLLAGLEKGTGYYLQNHLFLTKMALLVLVLLLEIRPMITLIRWRKTVSRGESPDTSAAPLLARISFVQAWLIVLMVFAATAMARGLGM